MPKADTQPTPERSAAAYIAQVDATAPTIAALDRHRRAVLDLLREGTQGERSQAELAGRFILGERVKALASLTATLTPKTLLDAGAVITAARELAADLVNGLTPDDGARDDMRLAGMAEILERAIGACRPLLAEDAP